MLPRVLAFLPLRPFSGLSLSSGSREASGAVSVPLAALSATVRTENNNIQRYFGISSVIYSQKDAESIPEDESSKKTSESQGTGQETLKRDLLDIIKTAKAEPSTAAVQTAKPLGRKLSVSLKAKLDGLQRAGDDAPKKGNAPLSPELVEAAAAVADSLPFDKQTTKSELLQQLQQHEEESRTQERGRQKISFSNIISDMKIDRSSVRSNRRTVNHIQFDEEADVLLDQKMTSDLKQGKSVFMGKRLNIFDDKTFADEAPEPARSPSLWEIEFAKQLATVNEQPLKNGFEEMIQWTKEGKLWEFPLNNEAGFDDDGSEFHEHVFLDKHLEGFPKQGPIRHFMELVTCGLSKNPYLSVKQKVEHIDWFRNYFNEKRDCLKESDIQLTQQLEEKCI